MSSHNFDNMTGSTPDVLHGVVVPMISNSACNSDYGGGITNSMICAGARGVGGVDACQVCHQFIN